MSLESRVELILQNILGASNEVDPESRVEKLLQNLIEVAYIVDPMSRVELLLENLQGGSNEVVPMSRVEMLIANALGATYDVTPMSRVEELLALIAEEYATVYKTVTGAIVTFDDAVPNEPFKSLVVDIDPVQDLHGYESPWVGGGGKNLLDPSLLKDQVGWNIIELNLKPNTVYVLSTDYSEATLPLYFIVDGEAQGSATKVTSDHYVRRATSETVDAKIIQRRSSGEDSFQNYHWQLEETVIGDLPTDWTPYENICPISGWTGANVVRAGKNLINVTDYDVVPNSSYSYPVWTGNLSGTFTLSVDKSGVTSVTNPGLSYGFAMINGARQYLRYNTGKLTFTGNLTQISIYGGSAYAQVVGKLSLQLEVGSEATPYEPYNGTTIPISWQTEAGTVYGGKLDVLSGVLTVDSVKETYNGTEEWIIRNPSSTSKYFAHRVGAYGDVTENDIICDVFKQTSITGSTQTIGINVVNSSGYNASFINLRPVGYIDTNIDAFKSWLAEHPITVVYGITTPIEIQLTPHEVNSLLGTNNIFADTGDTSAEYKAYANGG